MDRWTASPKPADTDSSNGTGTHTRTWREIPGIDTVGTWGLNLPLSKHIPPEADEHRGTISDDNRVSKSGDEKG